MKYDFLVVGSGLFGATLSYELKKIGKRILVIDKRSHVGGNVYTKTIDDINVHMYGIHVFHTNSIKIWRYVNQLTKFNDFINRPKARYKKNLYSLPINLMTFYQVAGCVSPAEANEYLNRNRVVIDSPSNLEEWIISRVGMEIYEILIRGYTIKQWKKHPRDLPISIIRRMPIRTTFDDNYYDNLYQGIPIGGYTKIIENMLDGIDVELGVDFFNIDWKKYANKLIYSGPIDRLFDYEYGELEYRTLEFEHETLLGDFQGQAQINYTEESIPYTRIIEHKHLEFGKQERTIITKEYPTVWQKDKEPYYPINDKKNNSIYKKYKSKLASLPYIIGGGRLCDYTYYDMDAVIGSALQKFRKIK